jgi:endonuclease/exonuclease/phosphatase family metal-dependent hydrolase
LFWLAALVCAAQPGKILVTTLNCHAFFGGGETHMELGQPETSGQFWQKAQNLVNLWPTNPPMLVALQEIGGAREAVFLAQLAAARYGHSFQPVFAETKDTFTGEAVGAIVDLSQGWKISGQPGRAPELDKDLSRHLALLITNRVSALEICVVHLKRPIGQYGRLAQQKQCRALKTWADARLAANPRANVIVLGDFNETTVPGATDTSLVPLVPPAGALRDVFVLAGGSFHTHAYGKAYDRVLISRALEAGEAHWKFETVFVQRHNHGKGAEKNLFTDHFPVTAVFDFVPKQ